MRRSWLIPAAVAFSLALPTLRNGFAIDDHYLVVDNPAVRSLANVPSFFLEAWGNQAGGARIYTQVNAAFWRPLSSTVMTLEYALFGAWAAPYHLVNALLHALVTALVTVLCTRIAPTGALAAGLLFAVHPVHTEVIAAVTYQTSLLSAALTLLCLLSVQREPRKFDALASFALSGLALLAKEDAVVVPLLASCSVLLQRGIDLRARLLRGVLPMFAATALVLWARSRVVLPSGITYFGDASSATVARTILGMLVLYLELLIAPLKLCVFYDWFIVPFETELSLKVVLGASIVVGWCLAVIVALRKEPRAALALCWLALPLLPVMHVVPILIGAAERFLYVPSIGLSLLVSLRAWPRWGLAVIALFALRSELRFLDWYDDRTLNEATARDFPETPVPLLNLVALDRDDAAKRAHLEEALRRAPGFPPALERLRELSERQGAAH